MIGAFADAKDLQMSFSASQLLLPGFPSEGLAYSRAGILISP